MNLPLYYVAKILKKLRGSAVIGSTIHPTSKIGSGSAVVDSKMSRNSYCGYDCSLVNAEIGAFCSIASRVSIGGARHPIEFASTSPAFLSHKDSLTIKYAKHRYLPKPTTFIGNDVWIGEGVFIKAGVEIGDGAVIGMATVVTRNVSPYSIVAGNPARLIRMRFESDIIEAFLRMKWWDMSDSELCRLGPYFDAPRAMLQMEKWL